MGHFLRLRASFGNHLVNSCDNSVTFFGHFLPVPLYLPLLRQCARFNLATQLLDQPPQQVLLITLWVGHACI